MAENKGKICNAFTGGGEHALDAITDHQAGYWSFVLDDSSNLFVPFSYVSEDLTEDLSARPRIVRPDDNSSGSGVWKEWMIAWDQIYGRPAVDAVEQGEQSNFNLPNTHSAVELQAIIDAAPHYIPYGSNLFFTFNSNGAYSLDASLSFNGFTGGGQLIIRGNDSEPGANTLHTGQENTLTWISGGAGLHILNNSVYTIVRNLKITGDTGAGHYPALNASGNSGFLSITANWIMTDAVGYGYPVGFYNGSHGFVVNNYIGNGWAGVWVVQGARVYTYNNADTGTQPSYGVVAWNGGFALCRDNGLSGSTADFDGANGGAVLYNGTWYT